MKKFEPRGRNGGQIKVKYLGVRKNPVVALKWGDQVGFREKNLCSIRDQWY